MADPKWLSIVAEAARQTLESTSYGLLLSKVPTVLKNSGIDPEEILRGRKLREFLQNEGESKVFLVQDASRPELWAVIPAGVDPEPPSKFFEPPETKEVSSVRRFISAFWQAFARPIPHGHRRWLLHSPSIHFEDIVGVCESSDAVEVERKYTNRPDELVIANSVVIERIEEWANSHGVNANNYIVTEPTRKAEFKHDVRADRNSLLHQLISVLPEEDLTRIAMPLDVIKKLLIGKH